MAIYEVVCLPHPVLRQMAEPVTVFDDELKKLIDDMIETMYYAKGIGLAAPQIAIAKRIATIDVSREGNQPFCIINPEILETEGQEIMEAGCLSVPGAYEKTPRAVRVKVRAQDVNGKFFEIDADGLLAHCLQHEIDHLNGKLIVDYLSPLKRKMALKKLEKHKRTMEQ